MESITKSSSINREEMFSLISLWQSSGLSQQSFCKQRHLAYHTFQYWLKKYKEQQCSGPSFIEMKFSAKKPSACCEIIFPTGAKMIFDGSADIAVIRSLVF